MNRWPRWSLCLVLLTGCTSLPPPAPPEPEVPSGAPWGLAWIPPSGEVAIRAGAIEHVLYPQASAEKRASAPLDPKPDGESASQRARLSHLRSRVTPRARADRACEEERDAVPAWFHTQRLKNRALTVKPGDACGVPPKK